MGKLAYTDETRLERMLTVIGCGNINRMDDGAGVQAARRINALLDADSRSRVRVIDAGTSGIDAMLEAAGSSALIYIDACISDADPGSVRKLSGAEVGQARHRGVSLHDFRWDHAWRLGRELFKDSFPEDVTVFLVEAESVEFGVELSPAVDAAVDDVVRRIVDGLEA